LVVFMPLTMHILTMHISRQVCGAEE
jgi:hypothetical protein